MNFMHLFSTIGSVLSDLDKKKIEHLLVKNYQLISIYQEISVSNITIEYHSEDSPILASFDVVSSSGDTHHFHLHPRILVLINNDITRFETILLHEIIHGLDHFILHKQYKLTHIESISTQLALIHYLATIRNEGVAVLTQKIVQNHSVSNTLENAVLTIENELNSVLKSCINKEFHQRISTFEFQNVMHQLHQKVYSYADVILYLFCKEKLKINKYPELNDFIEKANLEEKQKLISYLFTMDVSEWIQQLISIEQANEIRLEIKIEFLIHLCSIINPKNFKNQHTLLDDIPQLAFQNKPLEVIKILEEIVPKKHELDYILLQLENTLNYKEDLEIEIYNLCHKLLLHRNENTSHLIDLALSYHLSKEDIIHDNIHFLGKQDDWIVLDSIYILLNLNH